MVWNMYLLSNMAILCHFGYLYCIMLTFRWIKKGSESPVELELLPLAQPSHPFASVESLKDTMYNDGQSYMHTYRVLV